MGARNIHSFLELVGDFIALFSDYINDVMCDLFLNLSVDKLFHDKYIINSKVFQA